MEVQTFAFLLFFFIFVLSLVPFNSNFVLYYFFIFTYFSVINVMIDVRSLASSAGARQMNFEVKCSTFHGIKQYT